jgi:DNA adenine methylase
MRWQGNKSKHINKFIQYIPEFSGTYIEPFLGSGALFLKLQPKKWIINDLNKDVINIWNSVKNHPNDIIHTFKQFGKKFKQLPKQDKINYCRDITSKIDTMTYDVSRASIYLLMLYCSYVSNIIINDSFYFEGLAINIYKNIFPFLNPTYNNNLHHVSTLLNNKQGHIYNKSYEHILKKAKKNDFVFLDPPYIEEHKYRFNYNKNEFETLDISFLKKLYNQVQQLDKKNVYWLMTQANTPQVKHIFKDYTIKKIKVYRLYKKSYVDELVIMNYTP